MNVLDILFLAILGIGIVANFLSIPGNLIILFNSFWYGLVSGQDRFSTAFLLTLLIVALAVEFLEYLIIAFGARRFGATRLGCVAAVVGGIVGSVSGFCFSPVMGAIVGGFLGVVVGTFGIEMLRGKNVRESFHATLGALLGRVGGLTVKVIGTVTMAVMVLTHVSW
jgi:uncharacterized protein YqgC (DUF456 family)